MTSKKADRRVQHTQRFNWTTYKELADLAQANKRSVSGEIELRIEKSLREEAARHE